MKATPPAAQAVHAHEKLRPAICITGLEVNFAWWRDEGRYWAGAGASEATLGGTIVPSGLTAAGAELAPGTTGTTSLEVGAAGAVTFPAGAAGKVTSDVAAQQC